MILPKDLLSESYRKPKVILCQTNKDKICQLDATGLTGTFKFNSYSEISFNVASIYHDLITGEQKRTPYYDYIEGLRLVYLEGFGYFQLQNPELYSDGIQEYKQINAYSLEYTLSQKYLGTFIINKGDVGDTIGSIDGVVLYNPLDVDHSLLHLVLQKAYGWTIGHVDDELASQSRSFEVDRESIYDFIMNDMCDTFKCYVEFDTINNTVNVYSENEIERFIGDGETDTFKLSNGISETTTVTINGHVVTQYKYNEDTKELILTPAPAQGDIVEVTDEFKHKYDTDIIIAFENLSNEMKVNYSSDDIKTVLTVKGADDLDIRNVNFGLPTIMNLDYYCTPEWMGEKLYNEYLSYVDKQDKYMSGFYSRDIAGSTEETFNVETTKESFVVGNTQEFIAKGLQESFNANGDVSYFNIDKAQVTYQINSVVEKLDVKAESMVFVQPKLLSEKHTVELDEKTFILKNKIIVPKDTKVYVNDEEINENQYEYDANKKELTIVDDSLQLSTGDIIKIETPENSIQTNFIFDNPDNKNIVVKVNGEETEKYETNTTGLKIADDAILNYGDTVIVELIDNKFNLSSTKDRIISVTVNDRDVEKYIRNGNVLSITDNSLRSGNIVSVKSVGTENTIDLSQHKDKVVVSVSVGENEIDSYTLENYRLTVNYEVSPGDEIVVKLVNNKFAVPQVKDRILSAEIDSNNIQDYFFSFIDDVLTINELKALYNGTQVILKSVDEYFILNKEGRATSVFIDGIEIGDSEFDYDGNKLTITSNVITPESNIIVEFVDTSFHLTISGRISSVSINGKKIENYSFDESKRMLIIDDESLISNCKVSVEIINNMFYLSNVQENVSLYVYINEIETKNYELKNNELTIKDTLKIEDTVSAEYTDNHFQISGDIGLRHVVEKESADGSSESIQEGTGYEYDDTTKILTINVPLKNGEKIVVKNIDTTNTLRVVQSNAKEGEILLEDVTPTLKSYEPKVGDYVIKIESYTTILKQLYELIDKQLTEENSVPDEYEITEIKLNPDNFNDGDKFLPEADIEHLGNVYKITNQEKIVDESGGVSYNDIAYKYYVCEMKMSTYVGDDGKEQQQYKYVWNERELVFGGDGINSLKERIDIYSAINDIQIAAEWDQKPQDSDEYQSYSDNLKKLQDTKKELEEKQKAVDSIEEEIKSAQDEIRMISEDINVNKNFSPESLDRLSLFLREDEYSDDCFCTTDIDTDLDIINTQKELLVAGYKKLKTISRPTLSFSASMKNIYAIPEFEPILHQFKLGNFIKVRIRKDFIKKARLLEVQLDFDDLSNFSCTFGDLLSAKDQGDIHADLLAQAINAGKAVASGSANWQKGYNVATAIDEKIKQGLIDATTSIKSNSAGQDISWDNYGIHLRKVVDGILDKHEGWITNNKFLYSDDNFQTTKSVFGNYTIEGETYWGILAGCVSAGLIEGSHIIGGEICIGLQEDGTYAFKVDKDGTVTMNKGDAAEKLSYFSFDGDNGLIVGENKEGDYFSRVSAQKIEFCRKARIIVVTSEPTHKYDNYDYVLYQHTEGSTTYFDYYKNPDFIYKNEEPSYEARAIGENFEDPEIKFGIPITYFANNTAYMKQAEIEGSLKVGTEEETPYISLKNFRIQIESNGSLSIVAT